MEDHVFRVRNVYMRVTGLRVLTRTDKMNHTLAPKLWAQTTTTMCRVKLDLLLFIEHASVA
jgi:hypothetical protein